MCNIVTPARIVPLLPQLPKLLIILHVDLINKDLSFLHPNIEVFSLKAGIKINIFPLIK